MDHMIVLADVHRELMTPYGRGLDPEIEVTSTPMVVTYTFILLSAWILSLGYMIHVRKTAKKLANQPENP